MVVCGGRWLDVGVDNDNDNILGLCVDVVLGVDWRWSLVIHGGGEQSVMVGGG